MTRWKMMPSKYGFLLFSFVLGCVHSFVPSARPTKFSTVLGVLVSKSSTVKLPSDVSKCASVAMDGHSIGTTRTTRTNGHGLPGEAGARRWDGNRKARRRHVS